MKAADVPAHSLMADRQDVGDHSIRVPLSDELQDLGLSWREPREMALK